jgi:type II secretory pathway pseudopilin PulG
MIELIFVIVILGILAAVALPRFVGVQDDAQVSSEKTGIGSIRSSLQAIRGRALVNADRDVNVTFLDERGGFHQVNLGRNIGSTLAAAQGQDRNLSINSYPNAISLSAWNGDGKERAGLGLDETDKLARASGESGPQGSLGAVLALEPDGRSSYTTFEGSAAGAPAINGGSYPTGVVGGALSVIIGPASRTVTDSTLDLCIGRGWLYNSVSGNITIIGQCRQL